MSILDEINSKQLPCPSGCNIDSHVTMENLRKDLSLCKAELGKSVQSIRQLQDENERLRSRLGAEERDSVPHGVEEGQSPAKMARPRLPVELITLISEFLLGVGLFGTLASLNMTCHAVQQETDPVLNETLMLDMAAGWWVDVLQKEDDLRLEAKGRWKHTEYIVSTRGQLYEKRSRCFPNLKVWIVKHSDTPGTYPENMPICTAEIAIHKSVGIQTLWNLLQTPLQWPMNGSIFRLPIQGISKVRLEQNGHVTGRLDSPEEYLEFSNPCYLTEFDLLNVESSAALERTMMHLSRLMQPSDFLCTRRNDESEIGEPEGAKLADRALGVQLGAEDAVYYAVLSALDAILARGIAVDVRINHGETCCLTQRQMRERMIATREVYKRNFSKIREARRFATAGDQFFYMLARQAISDKETEGLDEDFPWPRTLCGEIFFDAMRPRQRDALWVYVESGGGPMDSYNIMDETIRP